MSTKTVLFLCTGNYYRSRFAECLFNHLAPRAALQWLADSRGLALGRQELVNVGPISPFTIEALLARSIPLEHPAREPRMASSEDFSAASKIIALKEDEHRPLLQRHFPEWADRVVYWQIHDLDFALPETALPQIEARVRELIVHLAEEPLAELSRQGRS